MQLLLLTVFAIVNVGTKECLPILMLRSYLLTCSFYEGGYWVTSTTNSVSSYNGRYFNNTYRLWDEVSSIKNHNSGWYNFHHDINYGGPYLNVPAGTEYSYLGDGNNDRFFSHY